ncbi:unnamed protein product [Brassica rapa]|uniref:Uncharacterized protein n=2 Tax=Brassica TaxID=3705 RepID=A0A8D9DTH4_BRACM|nr:unnamed protein product [Brassica napus]CAG7879579.1 unnamed protein product [Brassica rapa]
MELGPLPMYGLVFFHAHIDFNHVQNSPPRLNPTSTYRVIIEHS